MLQKVSNRIVRTHHVCSTRNPDPMLQVIESGVVIMKSQGKEPSDACMERAWISFDAMAFGQDPYHLPNSSATRLEHIGI